MRTASTIDHVRIEPTDQDVRCGNAVFTSCLGELRVAFDSDPRSPVVYDLRSIPFNRACRLYGRGDRPTPFLICNQWGTVHVRWGGPTDSAQRYPALKERQQARRVSVGNDVLRAPNLPLHAFHPNSRIPIYVTCARDYVKVTLQNAGIPTFETRVPLRKIGRSSWYVPRDTHGQPLPLRLRRSFIGSMLGVERVDVEWIG